MFIVRVVKDTKEVDFQAYEETSKEAWQAAWEIKAALPEAWKVEVLEEKGDLENPCGILYGNGEEVYF